MEDRYTSNRIFLTKEEQDKIKNVPILIGGAGIGSVIAECILRFGFENITIVDSNVVEVSKLNRENYIESDIDTSKSEAIKKRLLNINSKATITALNCMIDEENITSIIEGHKIAINTLDHSSNIPLLFDEICRDKEVPVLHSYNLGWGGLVTIINPNSLLLDAIFRKKEDVNEMEVIRYAASYMRFWGKPQSWLDEIIAAYKKEKETLPPPQLCVSSWLVASMCTSILYKIVIGKEVKVFPEFYLSVIDS
ncbi:ThiF family protein [Tenacibaculum sp. 190130A14a]|uniref:ThiF family protein n=1 Tax=Tenacibaculum polynesiense TaxID=3137857 RepID=A0ABP1EZL3_9FLAO